MPDNNKTFPKHIDIKAAELQKLIIEYIEDNSLSIYAIGFTLVFDQNETPKVLVGMTTNEEVEAWKTKHQTEAKYYIWNTAEYTHFEIETFYDFVFFTEKPNNRERYIQELTLLIKATKPLLTSKGYDFYMFINDIDNDVLDHYTIA